MLALLYPSLEHYMGVIFDIIYELTPKTRPRKAPDYNMEEDAPAEEHLPGIVGLTVDHAGLVSDEKLAEL